MLTTSYQARKPRWHGKKLADTKPKTNPSGKSEGFEIMKKQQKTYRLPLPFLITFGFTDKFASFPVTS